MDLPNQYLEGFLGGVMARQCGDLCRTYAEAIADSAESSLSRCVPGGEETARALKELLEEDPTPLALAAMPAAPPPAAPSSMRAPTTAMSLQIEGRMMEVQSGMQGEGRVTHFPIFLDLRGRRCLVVGGGEAAASRAAALARAGAAVTRIGAFRPAMLAGVALVSVAGASAALGEAVAREAQARAIPVNVMDAPHLCSFLMPAVVERGPVTIAIGTGGAAPMLARLLRLWLERALPRRLGALAAAAGDIRPWVSRCLPDAAARRGFWQRVFTGEVARRVLAGDGAAGEALAAELDATAAAAARPNAHAVMPSGSAPGS